jgi:hypothetical protein
MPMSFLKKLFGGSASAPANDAGRSEEHNGFLIRATPYKDGSQYQLCGVIEKEIDGVKKEHRFIRADKFGSMEEAISFTLSKGRLIIDQQGAHLFD